MNLKEFRELQISSGIVSDIKDTEWIAQEDLDSTESNSFEGEAIENAEMPGISCTKLMLGSDGWYYFRNGDPGGFDRPGTCKDDIAWCIPKKEVSELEVVQDKPCRSWLLKTSLTPYQLGVFNIEENKDYWIRTLESYEKPPKPKKTHWLTYTDDWIKREHLDHNKSVFRFKKTADGWYNVICKEPNGHIWTLKEHPDTKKFLTGQKDRDPDDKLISFKFNLTSPNRTIPTFEIEERTKNERLRYEDSDNAVIRWRRDGINRELYRVLRANQGSGPL